MVLTFWGVRGSIPCPLTPSEYRKRLSTIIHLIQPKDIVSPENKERFLANLPAQLGNTIGGNTTCLEVRSEKGDLIVVDGGTGLRELGKNLEYDHDKGVHVHFFITHFHWDHLQGIPFCELFFQPKNKITFYSKNPNLQQILANQMIEPYFPVPMSIFPAKIEYVILKSDPVKINDVTVNFREVSHPGGCLSYKFEEYGKSLIFSTDTELQTADFIQTKGNYSFYGKADVLIMDTQYTLGESVNKANWGHTSFSHAVDFALDYEIPRLYLFHHEPNYTDETVENLRQIAYWYAKNTKNKDIEVYISREGEKIYL